MKETYYKKAFKKATDKFIEEIKKNPSMSTEERLEQFRLAFIGAAIECINDLDARLQKLEKKGKMRSARKL